MQYLVILHAQNIFFETLLSLHLIKMVDDESFVDDFTDDDLNLASTYSSSSSESEGDALEGDNSLENCSNSGMTNNNHTNDAIEDETTTMTFASSFLSTPLLSNNNHTNDMVAGAPTSTHLSTSQFDLMHAVTTFDTNVAIEPKASFSFSSSTNSLLSKDDHTNNAMEDTMLLFQMT